MKLRFILPLATVVALIGLLGVGLKLTPGEVTSPLIGKPMPAFELPKLSQLEVNQVSGTLTGKPFLLNVWASWCVACRVEHESLLSLQRRGVVDIYGLNYKDAPEDALTWLERLGDPYVESFSDVEGRVGLDWGVYGVPETFVINHNGVIIGKKVGPVDDEWIENELKPLLEKG